MTTKQIIGAIGAVVLLAALGLFGLRSCSSGKATDQTILSQFESESTERLLATRAGWIKYIEMKGEDSEGAKVVKKNLREVDRILADRGIDPDSADAPAAATTLYNED